MGTYYHLPQGVTDPNHYAKLSYARKQANGRFRILSLDGGGSWSLIQVLALQHLFGAKATGRDVLACFDLVVANSGGSIALAALTTNVSLDKLYGWYLNEAWRKQVFIKKPFGQLLKSLLGLGPRYVAEGKYYGLQKVLEQGCQEAGIPNNYLQAPLSTTPGAISVGGSKTDLIIVNYDYDKGRAVFHRSNSHSPATSSRKHSGVNIVQAIHGASNAPVLYFDEPAYFNYPYDIEKDNRYWDGAIAGYNNPLMIGVTEALAMGIAREKAQVLSIGTASVRLPIKNGIPAEDPILIEKRTRSALFKDVKKMATSILDDPPDAATFIAYVVLGNTLPTNENEIVQDGSVIRLNPMIQPLYGSNGHWQFPSLGPDTATRFKKLVKLDMDAVNQAEVLEISNLAESWANNGVRNQAIRPNDHLKAQIGHDLFEHAFTQVVKQYFT